jgi:hypothetical protein
MKSIIGLLLVFSSFTAYASEIIDLDFNKFTKCDGKFQYEEVFLFVGRDAALPLVKDHAATELVGTIHFGKDLKPVTEAYSVELFENYIFYRHLKDIVRRFAIILVETQSGELPYDLLLVVTEGPLKGHVLASHPATFDLEKGTLDSVRFQCTSEFLKLK